MIRLFVILSVIFSFSQLSIQAQESLPLRVFDAYRGGNSIWLKYQNIGHSWYEHISQKADSYLIKRKNDVGNCSTLQRFEDRRTTITQKLLKSIGGLPTKTPLNAQVVEIIDRPTFTVEKMVYESQPGFYVTACLFLPKNKPQPLPTVIYCSGHTADGFRSPTYQRVIINLVKKGFAVFAFDPLGQGERYQYLDDKGKPIFGSTSEHSYTGIQSMLTGKSVARYMIFDGIRAVDYLISRPEIDGNRIGITGRSGGGTQSSYIAAFDERILAVAPENYITSFQRIWETIGPQDAEQNFLSANQLGIDHPDLLAVRAPKPALILTTYRDYFSIQGALESFEEVGKIYDLFEKSDQLQLAKDVGSHGSTQSNRERAYAFFQKYLKNSGDHTDLEVELFSAEDLKITETGQVVTSLNSKSVFDLLQEETSTFSSYNQQEGINWLKNQLATLPQQTQAVFTGNVLGESLTIEKYFLTFENGDYPLPFLRIKPNVSYKATILYLHDQGKDTEIRAHGEIAQLVAEGYEVIALDLLNIGELEANSFKGDSHISGISYNLVLGSSLVGTSLPLLQTNDILKIVNYLKEENEELQIIGIGRKTTCIPLAQAASLTPYFTQLILKEPLISWKSVYSTKMYDASFAYSITPDILKHFDIPDLIKWSSDLKIDIIQPTNGHGELASSSSILKEYPKQSLGEAYDNLKIHEVKGISILDILEK